MPDNEVARKVSVDYTMAAARAFTLQQAAGRKMRFLYVSGFVAERDQTKSLWYMGDYRRIRVSFPFFPFFRSHWQTLPELGMTKLVD